MGLLLTHLAVLTLSPPALTWLRRDLFRLLHRRRRWAPFVWTVLLVFFLLLRNLLPVDDAAAAAAAAACWFGREASTLPRRSRRRQRLLWLVSGLGLILMYSGGFRQLDWAAMFAASFCLVGVYKEKTARRSTTERKLAIAAPMVWLLAEAIGWFDAGFFSFAGHLCMHLFFCLRVAAASTMRPEGAFSTQVAEAVRRGSLHDLRNSFANILQLTRLAHAPMDEADRDRCLDLAGEFCEESLRTVGAVAAFGRTQRRGCPDRKNPLPLKSAAAAWREYGFNFTVAGGPSPAMSACLAVLVDRILSCALDLRLRCLRLDIRSQGGEWAARFEFAGNPMAAPFLGLCLRFKTGRDPDLRGRDVQIRAIALYPRSALSVECILKG